MKYSKLSGKGRFYRYVYHSKSIIRKAGILKLFSAAYKKIMDTIFWSHFYYLFPPSSTFSFKGKSYKYFYHHYNVTWRNERMVEIPIFRHLLFSSHGRILEVGNVLSHYFRVNHDILDKFEKHRGVINRDVVDFFPNKKYDLIISISTLEHVGWDEAPKDPEKVLRAVKNLKSMLKRGGKLIISVPLGYNSFLDQMIFKGRLGFDVCYYLKRVKKNRWMEVSERDVRTAKYGSPFHCANALVVCEFIKK